MILLVSIGSACSSLSLSETTNAEPVVTPANPSTVTPTVVTPESTPTLVQTVEIIQPTETIATVLPTAAVSDVDYPTEPEAVVSAFLTAYQDNPQDMETYLTGGRLADMPEGGVNAFLGISGQLDGFAIQSAAVSPNPPTAVIVVGMIVDGSETSRYFYLVFDYSRWVIDDIVTAQ